MKTKFKSSINIALVWAVKGGYAVIVRILFFIGASRYARENNGYDILFIAVKRNDTKVVKALLDNSAYWGCEQYGHGTALISASSHGHAEMVKLLLEQGCRSDDYDKFGTTPIIVASRHGHLKIVQMLLDAGADPNKTERGGRTALQAAIEHDHYEIRDILKTAGARLPKHFT